MESVPPINRFRFVMAVDLWIEIQLVRYQLLQDHPTNRHESGYIHQLCLKMGHRLHHRDDDSSIFHPYLSNELIQYVTRVPSQDERVFNI